MWARCLSASSGGLDKIWGPGSKSCRLMKCTGQKSLAKACMASCKKRGRRRVRIGSLMKTTPGKPLFMMAGLERPLTVRLPWVRRICSSWCIWWMTRFTPVRRGPILWSPSNLLGVKRNKGASDLEKWKFGHWRHLGPLIPCRNCLRLSPMICRDGMKR